MLQYSSLAFLRLSILTLLASLLTQCQTIPEDLNPLESLAQRVIPWEAINPPKSVWEWSSNTKNAPMVVEIMNKRSRQHYQVMMMHGEPKRDWRTAARVLDKFLIVESMDIKRQRMQQLLRVEKVIVCFPAQMATAFANLAQHLRQQPKQGEIWGLDADQVAALAAKIEGQGFMGITRINVAMWNHNRFSWGFTNLPGPQPVLSAGIK